MELLYRTISRLPDECRKLFLMACLDDMKYREIADVLKTMALPFVDLIIISVSASI